MNTLDSLSVHSTHLEPCPGWVCVPQVEWDAAFMAWGQAIARAALGPTERGGTTPRDVAHLDFRVEVRPDRLPGYALLPEEESAACRSIAAQIRERVDEPIGIRIAWDTRAAAERGGTT